MIQKKICMLGGFAVGKTSLVSRFVRSVFSDKYHSTVGVKVDKKAVVLQSRAREAVGPVPFVLMLNKSDLAEEWEVEDTAVETLVGQGWPAFRTSAKTGAGVEEAFQTLAQKMTDSR
jgi:GTPase SAR1 family protein